MPTALPAAQARRIALAAQGFCDPPASGRVDVRHLHRLLDRIAVLQIDSVNVFSRAHYLPVFARLGPYPRDTLDRLSGYRPHRTHPELFEYWAHAASLIAVRHQPLLRWRMQRAHVEPWPAIRRIATDRPGLLEDIRQLVAEQGPIRAGDTGIARPAARPGSMWNWHDGKVALEYLFYAGEVTTAKRVNFERYYDLPERVLPAHVLAAPTPDPADATRDLVRISARALGVATEPDLRDYFRLSHAVCKARVAELVDSGELEPVTVAGWPAPGYLWHEARRPRRVGARALLAPFDNLIWFRDRAQRLFDLHYRIGIYTPAARRTHGYYVLPFLLGDRIVGRVDLKSDRRAAVLRVQGAWLEDGVEAAEVGAVAAALAAQLRQAALWLELGEVAVAARGDLAGPLARAVAHARR